MNTVEQKFMELASIEKPDVNETIYTESVFGSEQGYRMTMLEYQSVILGEIKSSLRTTPLVEDRSLSPILVKNLPGKGIDFGLRFVHKFTREVIFTIVVSEDLGWTYESSAKQDDGLFIERSANLSATDSDDLRTSVIAELNADLAYYAGKRLTFK